MAKTITSAAIATKVVDKIEAGTKAHFESAIAFAAWGVINPGDARKFVQGARKTGAAQIRGMIIAKGIDSKKADRSITAGRAALRALGGNPDMPETFNTALVSLSQEMADMTLTQAVAYLCAKVTEITGTDSRQGLTDWSKAQTAADTPADESEPESEPEPVSASEADSDPIVTESVTPTDMVKAFTAWMKDEVAAGRSEKIMTQTQRAALVELILDGASDTQRGKVADSLMSYASAKALRDENQSRSDRLAVAAA